MVQLVTRWAIRLVVVIAAVVVALAGFTMVKDKGLLSPFGINSEGQDTQVIQAVQRVQEVALLKLVIQGITSERADRELFGKTIPGTGQSVFLQYDFNAKLGINGEDVTVSKTGEHTYLVTVPAFMVIGYDKPTFKVATEDGGILSWVTTDIDKVDMVNEVFNEAAQKQYLEEQQDQLKDQAELFYSSLIASIDPAAVTTFEFRG